MKKSYVYIVAVCPATIDAEICSPVKIGVSDNPWWRIRDMQIGSPEFLSLFHTLECESRERAFEIEHALHAEFYDRRLHGEWFDVSPGEALDSLISHIDIDLYVMLKDVPLFLHAAREIKGVNQALKKAALHGGGDESTDRGCRCTWPTIARTLHT